MLSHVTTNRELSEKATFDTGMTSTGLGGDFALIHWLKNIRANQSFNPAQPPVRIATHEKLSELHAHMKHPSVNQ